MLNWKLSCETKGEPCAICGRKDSNDLSSNKKICSEQLRLKGSRSLDQITARLFTIGNFAPVYVNLGGLVASQYKVIHFAGMFSVT